MELYSTHTMRFNNCVILSQRGRSDGGNKSALQWSSDSSDWLRLKVKHSNTCILNVKSGEKITRDEPMNKGIKRG